MSEPPRYDDTLSGNIQNTLPQVQTEPHEKRGKSDKKRQKRQSEIESAGDVIPARYQPYDLKSLTFKPIGSEQEVDVWHASPEQFHAHISQYVRNIRNVNIRVWPLVERLAVVNAVWEYCQSHGHQFPFVEHQHLVPDANALDVPLVNAHGDTSASEAV